MKRKRLLQSSIILLFLLVLTVTVADAGVLKHPLNFNVELSNGGYVKDNCSVPVTVDIQNNGGNFEGRLSLVMKRYYKKDEDFYYQEIRIPRNGRKRFFLYVPQVRYVSSQIYLRISRKGDYVEKQVTARRANHTDLVLIALNRQRGGLAYMTGFNRLVPSQAAIHVVYPDSAKLPIHWKSYDSVDVVLINDLPSLGFDRARERALLNYVISGGTVVFSTNLDPNEFNGSLFKDYLPIKPERTKRVVFENKNVFDKPEQVIMTGASRSDLIQQVENVPLVYRRTVGLGQVYFIAVDLSKKPFKPGFEETGLWKSILTDKRKAYNELPPFAVNDILYNIPEAAAPQLGVIFWLLLFYIVLVGPVNYYYLKKKDQLLKLFLTVPAIALGFSLIMFLIGFSTKGSSLLLRSFSVVYTRSGKPGAMVHSVVSLFSPTHYTYDVTMTDPHATGWELGSGNPPPVHIREGEKFVIEDQKIPMWSSRQYQSFTTKETKALVTFNVTPDSNGFSGTVVNNSNYHIKDCIIYGDGKISMKFDLPPGEKKLQAPVHSPNIYSPRALENALKDIYKIDPGSIKNASRRKKAMLHAQAAAIRKLSTINVRNPGNAMLIGWNTDEINPVKINRGGGSHFYLNLFIVR